MLGMAFNWGFNSTGVFGVEQGKKEMHQYKDITRGFVKPPRPIEAAY
jgi:hypothetical protein